VSHPHLLQRPPTYYKYYLETKPNSWGKVQKSKRIIQLTFSDISIFD